jgi:hypothetical protein
VFKSQSHHVVLEGTSTSVATRAQTYIRTYTYIHAYIHTYIHVYIRCTYSCFTCAMPCLSASSSGSAPALPKSDDVTFSRYSASASNWANPPQHNSEIASAFCTKCNMAPLTTVANHDCPNSSLSLGKGWRNGGAERAPEGSARAVSRRAYPSQRRTGVLAMKAVDQASLWSSKCAERDKTWSPVRRLPVAVMYGSGAPEPFAAALPPPLGFAHTCCCCQSSGVELSK